LSEEEFSESLGETETVLNFLVFDDNVEEVSVFSEFELEEAVEISLPCDVLDV
jgi:hypothetical protein